MDKIKLAWTTFGNNEDAEGFAEGIVKEGLAVCVQVDGGCRSYYRWEGKVEVSDEVRVWIKFFEGKQGELEAYVEARHPYDTPQWVVVGPLEASEGYLGWANGDDQETS